MLLGLLIFCQLENLQPTNVLVVQENIHRKCYGDSFDLIDQLKTKLTRTRLVS